VCFYIVAFLPISVFAMLTCEIIPSPATRKIIRIDDSCCEFFLFFSRVGYVCEMALEEKKKG
jgi:hypothetical protein